jgi:hypothetical protein
MKYPVLLAVAVAMLLGGCASNGESRTADADAGERYVPLGTLIPKRGPSRTDNVSTLNKQSMENDRIQGNNGLTDH